MDYITSFDIRLAKEIFYAGERISGSVLLENCENIKIKGSFVEETRPTRRLRRMRPGLILVAIHVEAIFLAMSKCP
ncbi:unnamed protein product [Nippostrongylus brasiliensis]|uniref:Sm domain-containing protein n=1 Tax=Nippostrongylus brasiliensis TaxID=27835 RepID=A0A0N4XET4_NIPBR|nr:unnamed protein product [Nippostrongylus brasiliensis]